MKETKVKRQILTAVLALLLMMTIVPVGAAAADAGNQIIPIKPTTLVYEGQRAPDISAEITDKDPVIWKNYRGKIYEFTLPEAGTLVLTLSPTKGSKGTEMIFSDSKTFSKATGNWDTLYTWSDLDDCTNDFSGSGKAGDKYYLAIANDAGSFDSKTSLQAAFYPAKNRTVELGKTYVFGSEESKKNYDFKFTADKSGYVAVKFIKSDEFKAMFSLLDQNKKRISGQYDRWPDVMYPNPMTFGVKKGKTYYLRVVLDNAGQGDRPNVIGLTNYTVKEKSGTSLKKAVKVKRNKTVKGYILPGKKTSDWYKIEVSKKRDVKFYLKNNFSDECYFDVYNKKGKKIRTKQKVNATDGGVLSKTKYVRLAKGTYYVKVYNKTKGDSGSYNLKWK